MKTRIGIPDVAISGRDQIASELESMLSDLIALALNGKQAHWHVTGPRFRSIHLQLDEIVADVRTWSDDIAERAITLGVTIDGRPDTMAKRTSVEAFPEGWLKDSDVTEMMADRMTGVIARMRERLSDLERDLVTQDLVIGIVKGLEKHLWMLQATIA